MIIIEIKRKLGLVKTNCQSIITDGVIKSVYERKISARRIFKSLKKLKEPVLYDGDCTITSLFPGFNERDLADQIKKGLDKEIAAKNWMMTLKYKELKCKQQN